MNRLVRPHYEEALKQATDSPVGEISEMFLNQARGMAEALFLIRELTSAEFEREMQRQTQIRVSREARGMSGVAA